jgi:hypothetical protein
MSTIRTLVVPRGGELEVAETPLTAAFEVPGDR